MRSAAFTTADLCDTHGDRLRVLGLPWRDFGGRIAFCGAISTVLAFEDNSRVREGVAEPGKGRVLLIAGGGSLRRSLLGDVLAQQAVANGWAGVVIDGALRDAAVIATLDLGVKALATCPRKTDKRGQGLRDVPIEIAGVVVQPGEWLYADGDGVVVGDLALMK
jgi:regulator of ribonuclease activity A